MTEPWQQPYLGFTSPAPARTNGLGIASLVSGIVALILSVVPFVGFSFGIFALAAGLVARNRFKRGEAGNHGITIAGVVLGILAIIIGGAVSFFIAYGFFQYQYCIDHAAGRGEYAKC
jgi:hypothetical protein